MLQKRERKGKKRKAMEVTSPQALATDSFSYSWLTNPTPSFDSLIKSLRPSFDNYIDDSSIDVFIKNDLHSNEDFDFNTVLPEQKVSDSLIHADELFSGGCIMPVYDLNQQQQQQHVTVSVPTTPVSLYTEFSSQEKQRIRPCFFLQKFKESSNRVLKKSFFIFSKLGCSREGVRVADLDRKVKEIRSRSYSNQLPSGGSKTGAEVRAFASDIIYRNEIKRKSKKIEASNYKRLRDVRSCNNSPLSSPPQTTMNPWHHHVECSIDEAILHCKRSLGSN